MADIKTLTITSVTAVYSGVNKNDNPFTIYEIEAKETTKALRSFDNLPIGSNDYEVEPYQRDGKVTYTLKPHGFKAARDDSFAGGTGDLQEIKNRLTRVEQRVFGSDVTPPADDWGSQTSQSDSFGGDDDIPF